MGMSVLRVTEVAVRGTGIIVTALVWGMDVSGAVMTVLATG
jgi:hypothetical protein